MIRKYAEADLDDVESVWEHSAREVHHFFSKEFFTQEKENLATLYLPNTETWVWVDELGLAEGRHAEGSGNESCNEGRVVGFVSMLENEIGGLFVSPDFQRRGIGHALVQHIVKLRQGEIVVQVFQENAVARKFYDREGFAFVDRTTHDATGQVLLRLRLASN